LVRKRRTRQHVIADLAINYVERQALLCGYTVQRQTHDYGIDLYLATYDRDGYVETGAVLIQGKATDTPRVLADGQTIALSVEIRDLERWLDEKMPVILVLYDGGSDVLYWLDVQSYFRGQSGSGRSSARVSTTVRLPMANRLDVAAMTQIALIRNEANHRAQEVESPYG
jgi:hypothetical protein